MTSEVPMTRPLANVLRIAALAAVVVFASAFDWKPKPTAELKADLVAYANSVGETELAEAVNGASGTAEWMRAAIKRGSELLKASEGGDFNDKNREHGLRIIDYPLHLDNYDMDKERMLSKCPPADVIIASTWNNVQGMVNCCAGALGFDRTKSVLLPSHENELGHSVDHRESYREMYTRKDRLGNREFPWPRVHPLGYGESFLFTKTK